MTDAAFWNELAETYAQKPVEDPDAFERKIAITLDLMTPRDTVLDIGCGTGSLALKLAPHALHVHGLDLSSEMIRIAREKATTQQVLNATFHTGLIDKTRTLFEANTLDGLCAYSILHLVEDRRQTLDLIYRSLKPGGYFVSSTVCLGESHVPYKPLLRMMRWLGKAPMVHVFSKQTLVGEFEDAGFINITHPEVGAKATVGFMVCKKPQ